MLIRKIYFKHDCKRLHLLNEFIDSNAMTLVRTYD